MVRGRRAEAPVPCSDVSFRLDQKTGNFKDVFLSTHTHSRLMQWSGVTEGNQKYQLAQKEFRLIKTIIILIRGGHYRRAFASISALHCSKRRVTSRWPLIAERCSGVHSLKETKESTCHMKMMNINEGQTGAGGNHKKSCAFTASASAIT